MTIRRRLTIGAILLAASLVLYGTARHYSSSLIFYVVEQSLLQKAPPGTDPGHLRERLRKLVLSAANPKSGMEKLLRISEQLEKVQVLTPEDVDRLLAI